MSADGSPQIPTLRSRKHRMVPYVTSSTHSSETTFEDLSEGSSDHIFAKIDKNHSNQYGRSSIDDEEVIPSPSRPDRYTGNGTLTTVEVADTGGNVQVQETAFITDSDQQPLLSSDDREYEDDLEVKVAVREETSLSICLQVVLPYIIAGFGMVAAGMVLDVVQHWDVYREVSEIYVLVPSLLGLKGNLEMTLASRLSTQANLGTMDKKSEQWKLIGGNMALIQAQAIVVGFLASLVAMVMGWIPDGDFSFQHGLLLCASSMCTASLASFVLGCIMVGVVLVSHKCNVNPDNVATPIAASLGDLTTLAMLSGIGCVLYKELGREQWLAPTLIVVLILLTPLWIYVSIHNKYTNVVVYSGWTPVISAMAISSVGGLILDFTVANYNGIAVFQPVINGVGGNLVAVQASRICTSLHQGSTPGKLPANTAPGCPNCPSAFFGKHTSARAARVLLGLVVPGHLIFMYTISFMKAGHTSITVVFAVMFLVAALLQVAILLYVANWIVHFIWLRGDDPDNVAIPYLTALGDLLGTAFLAAAFHVLFLIGDRDSDVGD